MDIAKSMEIGRVEVDSDKCGWSLRNSWAYPSLTLYDTLVLVFVCALVLELGYGEHHAVTGEFT